MTEFEKLNERITQLTELVKTGSKAIESMEAALRAAEEERDRLADRRRESEPKFERVEIRKPYWSVGMTPKAEPRCYREGFEYYEQFHRNCFDNNNYFHTKERAQEVADKINLLLKLERLHDTFCPDYFPNWNDKEWKYYVSYGNSCKHYKVNSSTATEQKANVYFPTLEIAQKVCDILNAEWEETW